MYQVLSLPCIGDVAPLKFNAILVCFSGILFFSGWWIMIALMAENTVDVYGFLPGLFATVGLILVNIIPTSHLQQPNLYAQNTRCGGLTIKTCLLIGFMISFSSLIGACYILFNDYLLNHEELNKWPGYGIFLQNLFTFVSTLLLKCTRPQEYF